MAEMRWNLGLRPTRRKRPVRKGDYPDMRRIVRRNLKYGAELLELTWRGERPLALGDGLRRSFLEDGDTVVMRGWCEGEGAVSIGLGEVRGTVLPAL